MSVIIEYIKCAYILDGLSKGKYGSDTIIVDSYFGPAVEKDPLVSFSALKERVLSLRSRIQAEMEGPSKQFVINQINAMLVQIDIGLGKEIPYENQVQSFFEISANPIAHRDVEAMQEAVKTQLKNRGLTGDITEEIRKWRITHELTGDQLFNYVTEIAQRMHHQTKTKVVTLPDAEEVDYHSVKDKPWGAYNYYQGNFKSLVEINTDFPILRFSVPGFISHESYPGHHTYLTSHEVAYKKGKIGPEGTIAIINTPECTISEGLAETGLDFIDYQRTDDEMFTRALGRLSRAVGINAALMLNMQKKSIEDVIDYIAANAFLDKARAKARIGFISDPIWRPYTFTYTEGYKIIKRYFDSAKERNKVKEFYQVIYYEMHTPSTLKSRLSKLKII